MRILLLGHGRMGQLVESLAPEYGGTIAGVIDEHSGDRAIADGQFGDVDVAIDFTLADAVPQNLPQLAARRINVVIGTTGWQAQEAPMRDDREGRRHRRAGGVEFFARHERVSARRRRGEPALREACGIRRVDS